MEWVVDLAVSAVQTYQALDGATRAELRDQVALLAEKPAAYLNRSALLPDRMTFTNRSRVVERVTVNPVFAELDLEAQRLLLPAIGHASEPEEP